MSWAILLDFDSHIQYLCMKQKRVKFLEYVITCLPRPLTLSQLFNHGGGVKKRAGWSLCWASQAGHKTRHAPPCQFLQFFNIDNPSFRNPKIVLHLQIAPPLAPWPLKLAGNLGKGKEPWATEWIGIKKGWNPGLLTASKNLRHPWPCLCSCDEKGQCHNLLSEPTAFCSTEWVCFPLCFQGCTFPANSALATICHH